MVSMIVYSQQSNELRKIKEIVKKLIPLISEDKWNLQIAESMENLKTCIQKLSSCDILIFDITMPNALQELEKLRRTYKEAYLMVIASSEISPMSYMKPSIKAASLLLRPVSDDKMQEVLNEFLVDYIEKKEEEDPENVFSIETKGEVQYISYSKIYYFEARKRKLYLRTLTEEYPFVDTMDHLEQVLGEQFIRCHRSFIVNSRKIVGIALSDHIIRLTDELDVPLSRGYRSNIDKIIKSRK